MSDTGNIPAAMVEAARKAGRDAALDLYRQRTGLTANHTTAGPHYVAEYAEAAVVAGLAAAFAECEVNVNEGYRQRHPKFDDGVWHYCWDTAETQGNAARANRQWEGHYDPDGWTHEPVRRLVVVTPAQEGSNG